MSKKIAEKIDPYKMVWAKLSNLADPGGEIRVCHGKRHKVYDDGYEGYVPIIHLEIWSQAYTREYPTNSVSFNRDTEEAPKKVRRARILAVEVPKPETSEEEIVKNELVDRHTDVSGDAAATEVSQRAVGMLETAEDRIAEADKRIAEADARIAAAESKEATVDVILSEADDRIAEVEKKEESANSKLEEANEILDKASEAKTGAGTAVEENSNTSENSETPVSEVDSLGERNVLDEDPPKPE